MKEIYEFICLPFGSNDIIFFRKTRAVSYDQDIVDISLEITFCIIFFFFGKLQSHNPSSTKYKPWVLFISKPSKNSIFVTTLTYYNLRNLYSLFGTIICKHCLGDLSTYPSIKFDSVLFTNIGLIVTQNELLRKFVSLFFIASNNFITLHIE